MRVWSWAVGRVVCMNCVSLWYSMYECVMPHMNAPCYIWMSRVSYGWVMSQMCDRLYAWNRYRYVTGCVYESMKAIEWETEATPEKKEKTHSNPLRVCVCVFVCVYVCVCVCVCESKAKDTLKPNTMCVCACVYMYVCVCVCSCVCASKTKAMPEIGTKTHSNPLRVRVCVYLCMCMYVCACVCDWNKDNACVRDWN